ncbi:MAG: FkbM family methyltransferase [Rhodomicrobiaceae bacterium]
MSAKPNMNHGNADIRIDIAMQAAMTESRTAAATPFQYARPAKKPRGIRKVMREVARPFKQALQIVRQSDGGFSAPPRETEFRRLSAMLETMQAPRLRQMKILQDQQDAIISSVNEMRQEQAAMHRRCQRQPIPTAIGFQLLRLDDRYMALPETDFALLAYLIDTPVYEPGVASVLRQFAAGANYIIEVGANIGIHTVTMAREMRSGGTVLALEPTPLTFKALQISLTLNGISSRVHAHQIASGSSAGSQLLYLHPVSGQNSLIAWPEAGEDTLSVDVSPLDDLVPPGTVVDLVKIDAEGGEYDTLKGMDRILAENPDIVIVLEFSHVHFSRAGVMPSQLVQSLADRNLSPYLIDEVTGKLGHFDLEMVLAKPSANILFGRRSTLKMDLMDGS